MGIHKRLVEVLCKSNDKVYKKSAENLPEISGLTAVKDIDYVGDGNVYHLLDIIRPEGEELLPVIVDIHGGAWLYGVKDINDYYCRKLAKEGFVVVNVSYRLIKEGCGGVYPNMFRDIFDAFDWVADHIKEYGGDLNNVFLTGDSAGGHLAGFTSCVNADRELGEEMGLTSDLTFRAVGLSCPAVNVDKYGKIKLPLITYLYKLFFGEEGKKHKYAKLVSLQNLPLEKLPPVFLITGFADFFKGDSVYMKGLLDEKQVENELFYPKKRTENKLVHVYNVLYPDWTESKEANKKMTEFFKKHIVRE